MINHHILLQTDSPPPSTSGEAQEGSGEGEGEAEERGEARGHHQHHHRSHRHLQHDPHEHQFIILSMIKCLLQTLSHTELLLQVEEDETAEHKVSQIPANSTIRFSPALL